MLFSTGGDVFGFDISVQKKKSAVQTNWVRICCEIKVQIKQNYLSYHGSGKIFKKCIVLINCVSLWA